MYTSVLLVVFFNTKNKTYFLFSPSPPTPVAFKLQICFFSTVISEVQSSLLLSCDFCVVFLEECIIRTLTQAV